MEDLAEMTLEESPDRHKQKKVYQTEVKEIKKANEFKELKGPKEEEKSVS